MARFLCAVFLHISLNGETTQGLMLMKYANNHPWRFVDWKTAFLIGFSQFAMVITVEFVNLVILITNQTIMDTIMNFLALVIIADFDDYFFMTVDKMILAKLISDGEMGEGKDKRTLDDVLKIETTTSDQAFFKIEGNRIKGKAEPPRPQIRDTTAPAPKIDADDQDENLPP